MKRLNKQIDNYIKNNNKGMLKQYSKDVTRYEKLVFSRKKEIEDIVNNFINNDNDIQNKIYSAIYFSIKGLMTNGVTFKDLDTLSVEDFVKNMSEKQKLLTNKQKKKNG